MPFRQILFYRVVPIKMSVSSISSTAATDTLRCVRALWAAAHQLRLPVALWRLPESDTVQGIVDLSGRPQKTAVDLEEMPPGFAFSPFTNADTEQTLFLQADIHFKIEQSEPGGKHLLSDQNPPLRDPVLQLRREHFYRTAAPGAPTT